MAKTKIAPEDADFIMKMKKVQYSNCEIAQNLGVTEGANRYRIKRKLLGKKDGRSLKMSGLDRNYGVMEHWIADYEDGARRLTLRLLETRLRKHHGYAQSYDALRRYLRKHFPEFTKKGFRTCVETPPGKFLLLDWKEDIMV